MVFQPHRIHGTGIFAHIYHKNQPSKCRQIYRSSHGSVMGAVSTTDLTAPGNFTVEMWAACSGVGFGHQQLGRVVGDGAGHGESAEGNFRSVPKRQMNHGYTAVI